METYTWTVVVAGPERHDGESPYTWVVTEASAIGAGLAALSIHAREEEADDLEILSIRRGEPKPEDGAFNDRRIVH